MEHILRKSTALLCSAALACALVPFSTTASAYADNQDSSGVSDETNAEISDLQKKIESSAADYDSAVAKQHELQEQMVQNQAAIDQISADLPAQRQRSGEAMKSLYFLQQDGYGLLDMILGSQNLSEFIERVEYVDAINSHNNSEMKRLDEMHTSLQENQAGLAQAKIEADEEAERASRALEQAQVSRQQAQEKAAAEAAAQAAAQAAALAAAQQAAQEQAAAAEEAARAEGATPEQVQAAAEVIAVGNDTTASNDVSWSSDKEAFVSEWSGRIDAYLAGSPLSGKGSKFAEAAWEYGVDPRWSPAISNIESSKGVYNAGSYNAWGMSAVGGGWRSFGSWDEAIDTHVSYLGRVYGSTVTPEAAQKYCPPTWSDWYSKCVSEMNRI